MNVLLKIFLLITLTGFIQSHENSVIKLSGKPISSESLSSSSINNAFDGDLTTVFKSSKASNGWIGLKLDSKYIISKIGIAFPKTSRKEDYLLGILEGSTEPTFYESEPLYMITEELKLGEINYITIESAQKYKYIRYIGPNNKYCIISELEIYGDDELSIIKNFKNDDDDEEEYYYQATNLPLVIIQTEDSVEPIDKENYITSNIFTFQKYLRRNNLIIDYFPLDIYSKINNKR